MRVLLIVYDNNSYIHFFPIGTSYLASSLQHAHHDVTIYNQDVYHYPEEHLINYLSEHEFDAVGVGIIGGYYQYRKLLKLSQAINSIPKRPFFIIGGHGPSPEPGFFLTKTGADVVVIGEGEVTIVDLLDAKATGRDLSTVKGIAYLFDEKLVITEARELIRDIDSIPYPAWDLFPIDYYALFRDVHITNNERWFPILSGRGCPFKCNFCYRMDKGMRARSSASIVDEMRILKENYRISYFGFSDDLLMISRRRTVQLCEAIINANLNVKWSCNGRLNFVTPELIKLMKMAGCVFINYGIECFDDEILRVMNKKLTVEKIEYGVKTTLDEGIYPGLNIIFGNIGENAEMLQKGVDFLLKYEDFTQMRTIRPVTPYPGSPLYYYAIEKGLLKDAEDFYENKHVNSDLLSVNFTSLSEEEYYACLHNANKKLISAYYDHQKKKTLDIEDKLYFKKDSTFRGFRQS
jgi:anaerobic magnesium-protoporphyrin IX monomethyl ester cyclase